MADSNAARSQHKLVPEVFVDAFKASPVGIVLEDLQGQPLFVNRAFCAMLGFSEEEILAKHCVDFSPSEDAEKDWALFQQLRSGSIDHYHLDKRYFRQDGSLVWGRLSISLLDHRPSPIVIAMVEDITEKMLAQETLELATKEQLRYATTLKWRLEFESLLSDLSRTFISLPEEAIDAHMERGLALIGEFLELDRITLYELAGDGKDFLVTYTWTRDGVPRAAVSVRAADLPWWSSQVLNGQATAVSSVDDLPEEAAAEKEFLGRAGIVSAASIPLNVSGQITGTIAFSAVRRQVSWTSDVIHQLNVIGDIFSNALKRKRAMEERKQAEALLSNFSQKLIQAQEQERAAVGRELHDDVSQRVALTAMNLELLIADLSISAAVKTEMIRMMEQLRELAGDIQSLSHRLHSAKLDQLGLRRAAAGFCKEVSAKHKVRIEFESRNVPEKLPADISLCLYRVMQEAVQNAMKHSGSDDVQVLLTCGPDELQLVVTDSGKGFDPSEALNAKGIGLTGMQERLKLVNGELSIQTAPARGTTILARLPLEKA